MYLVALVCSIMLSHNRCTVDTARAYVNLGRVEEVHDARSCTLIGQASLAWVVGRPLGIKPNEYLELRSGEYIGIECRPFMFVVDKRDVG